MTHDSQTMPRHFGEFLAQRGSSPGVFLVKQRTPVVEVIDALVLIWAASGPEEWANRILEIPGIGEDHMTGRTISELIDVAIVRRPRGRQLCAIRGESRDGVAIR